MNIFFFGGTFDPPHIGHYNIVHSCLEVTDKFIIFPNKQSPDKKQPIVNAIHREKMLHLMFDNSKVEIDDFELVSNKKNYTIYTIEYLYKKYNNSILNMVIGLDQLQKIESWYKYDKVIKKVNIYCFNRNNTNIDKSLLQIKNIKFIKDFNCEISSSLIRKNINNLDKNELKKFLHKDVILYIKKNKLYVN